MATADHLPKLSVELDRSGSGLTAYLSGDVDLATAPDLLACVLPAISEQTTRVVVDLSAVTFCDSSGIAAFVEIQEKAQRRAGEMVLQDPTKAIRRVFDIVGLADAIPIVGVVK